MLNLKNVISITDYNDINFKDRKPCLQNGRCKTNNGLRWINVTVNLASTCRYKV